MFLKAHPMFDLNDYIGAWERRDTGFLEFMYCFARALVGMHEWNQRCEIEDFSKIVTVSDEVYLYVILEGNNMKWKKKYTDKVEIFVLWYGCMVLILIVCFVES